MENRDMNRLTGGAGTKKVENTYIVNSHVV